MQTVPHRELRNDSGRILARVRSGEVIGVTNHGELSAVLVPPGGDVLALLRAAGKLREPTDDRPFTDLDPMPAEPGGTAAMLADLRGDR